MNNICGKMASSKIDHLSYTTNTKASMTSLLTHTFEHSNRSSCRSKTNNQPIKKFLSQLSKSCQKWQNSDFQSQFSMSKIIRSFLIFFFFSLKNMILGAHLLLLTFFENFNFWTTLFPKMTSNFWRLLLNWVQDLKTF